jgi:LAS superfamily LD-carboxypeptidase LdcB
MGIRWSAVLVLWIALAFASTSVVDARTVTGYRRGQKTRVKLVEVGGVELEARTARAFVAMAGAAAQRGITLAIRSGFRSHEQQKELYLWYRRGWGNLAARPGYSNHQSGRAVDIYIEDYAVYEWLKQNARDYGFKRTVKREAWHWEYVGGGRRLARHAAARGPRRADR